MKIKLNVIRESASSLVIVLVLGAISLLLLGSTMSWTATTSMIVDSSIRHSVAVAAAEAATEKVISQLTADFSKHGASEVTSKLLDYRQLIPKSSESAQWSKFKFSDGRGGNDKVSVEILSPWTTGAPLISQYQGLKGYAATFRIKSDATDLSARHDITGAVQQEMQLALIPVFQFAIFYNMDLEINPGADMNIRGRVHGNDNVYLNPGAKLTFNGDVTGSGTIINGKKPGDPTTRVGITTFNAGHDSGVTSLNLPIGSDNTPAAVRAIVEIPPAGESVTSDLGKQRFYNNADLVIVVTNGSVVVRGGGIASGRSTNLSWSSVSNFVTLTKSFTDGRENKTINVTEIDVGKFTAWNNAGNTVTAALGRSIDSIYVADLRAQTAGIEPGVRLVNGATLPVLGLTVATPDPLYVQGNYNATGASVGSSNTANTKPAALIGDSINILSANWNDANSTKAIGSRKATSTTVNAAFLAGIVETGNNHYSGGVENFPRFLEDWAGTTFTYNGSMVVLYTSVFANALWPGTGTAYNPPGRNWNFDLNFLDPNKLPPLCPSVRAVIRGQWASIAPHI